MTIELQQDTWGVLRELARNPTTEQICNRHSTAVTLQPSQHRATVRSRANIKTHVGYLRLRSQKKLSSLNLHTPARTQIKNFVTLPKICKISSCL